MAEKNIKLKDGADVLYPITKIKNVIDDDGKTLPEILDELGGGGAGLPTEIAPTSLAVGDEVKGFLFKYNGFSKGTLSGAGIKAVDGQGNEVLKIYIYEATDAPYMEITINGETQSYSVSSVVNIPAIEGATIQGAFGYYYGNDDTPDFTFDDFLSCTSIIYAPAECYLGRKQSGEVIWEKRNVNALYVDGGKKLITVGTVIESGATILIDYDKVSSLDECYGDGNQYFYAGVNVAGSSTCDYGWNTESVPWGASDGYSNSIDTATGIVSFVYSGGTCTITSASNNSMYIQEDVTLYRINENGKKETVTL